MDKYEMLCKIISEQKALASDGMLRADGNDLYRFQGMQRLVVLLIEKISEIDSGKLQAEEEIKEGLDKE